MIRLRIPARLQSAFFGLMASVRERARYAEPKMIAMGALGAIGFPIYYVIWKWLFPQPYENLWLRLALAVMVIPPVFFRYWPAPLLRWLPLYWYVMITLCLPFFFTYMMLMNSLDTVWLISHVGSIFMLLLIFDLKGSLVTLAIGTPLACIAYALTPHAPIPPGPVLELLPVWLFVLVAGAIFNLSRAIEQQSRISTVAAIGATIAHELRTPLAAIRMAAGGSLRYIEPITRGYEKARDAGLDVEPLRASAVAAVRDGCAIIETEVNHAFTTIEMLLASGRADQEPELGPVDARSVIAAALERYPYGSGDERDRITPRLETSFRFIGSRTLLLNVLFNIIKNAIHHTARAGRGVIDIHVERGERLGRIVITDTGPGISPALLPRIFDRFVSGPGRSESGLGIGLAFCKEATERMGGQLTCRSSHGQFAEFTLAFPLAPPDPDGSDA